MTTAPARPMPTAAGMLQSRNPATGEVVGEVPVTPAGQIPAIVAKARAAQRAWRKLSFAERAKPLLAAGEELVRRADELGLLLTREMGKPLAEGVGEVKNCGSTMPETLKEIADALAPDILDDGKTHSTIHHDPLGVAAVIAPWNFPLAMPHWMVIPALLAGNTVVLKPSEETPLIAQAYVDILNTYLPKDVLTIIHGADEQGRTLVNADVELIAFTGSRATGIKIMNAASGSLKRLILELGGKDPMIVLDDADITAAAQFAVRNSFRNAGQVCVSTERIYVDKQIAGAFETEVAKLTAALKIGPGTVEGINIGPMINARQRDHVLKQLDEAVKQGAKVVAGGSGHHDNFVMPTVLTNVSHDMDIMTEETFGPIACIQTFDSIDKAVELANDTPYGLGAAVFGKDVNRAADVARQLDAGMIGINRGCGGASGSPWVGAKQSGFGWHSGKEGHRQFTQPRVISVSV